MFRVLNFQKTREKNLLFGDEKREIFSFAWLGCVDAKAKEKAAVAARLIKKTTRTFGKKKNCTNLSDSGLSPPRCVLYSNKTRARANATSRFPRRQRIRGKNDGAILEVATIERSKGGRRAEKGALDVAFGFLRDNDSFSHIFAGSQRSLSRFV